MGTEDSNGSSRLAPASSAALEQTLLRQRERSRSPQRGYDLRSRFVEYTDYHCSARRRRRWKRSPPCRDRAPGDDAAPGPSNTSSQLARAPRTAREQTLPRRRERSRSPRWGYDHRSWFVVTMDYDPSAEGRRRRVSAPQRCTSDKRSGRVGCDGSRL